MSNDVTKKIFSENLNKLIKKQRKTVMDLSDDLNISYSTVSDWKNGKKMPRGGSLQKLSDYFDVNLSTLLEENTFDDTLSQSKTPSTSIDLPFYGDVAAGALAEMESIDVGDVSSIAMPSSLLGKHATCTDLFAMKVNGDSMDNIIPSGSTIIVKPIEESLYKDGDIVVFSYNNEYSLKRFRPDAMEGFVLFEADSKNDDFKDIPISKDELYCANLYGKIIMYVVSL